MMKSEPVFQVLSLNDHVVELQTREYIRRKLHRKTKSGCLACKAKRVKCDESRPVCIRCQRNGRLCSYSPKPSHSEPGNNPSSSDSDCFSTLSAVTLTSISVSDFPKNGTSTVNLIQHFHTHWAEIFHMPRNEKIISISKSDPLVGNTILAIAACHLRHVSPGVLQHRIADHFQQSQALRDFQRVLDTPREQLGQSGVDSLMLSATLLNMIAFALPESEITIRTEPNTSWVFSTRDDRLGWLALQVGLRPLLLSLTAYLNNTLSFLGPIFFGGKNDNWEFRRMYDGLESVPQRWMKFFKLDGSGSGCDCKKTNIGEVLRAPVSILVHLRDLEPIPSNLFKNLQFLGKVQQEFRALLLEREERALWLFGYWLGVMCRYDSVWWCEKRSRRDYIAICMWLQQLHLTKLPGVEGEMWIEMMKELESAPVWIAGG